MKKEKFSLSILVGLFLIACIKLVSAANGSEYVQKFIEWVNSNYGPFFGALLGHESLDEFLFAKVLFLFLIFAIVFMTLKRIAIFESNRTIMFVVASIVSILAVRYLKENEFITGILLPYGALGASLAILLPLLIYFMFVHTSVPSPFGRRFAWFVYGAVFLILWGMRTGDMGSSNWIYTLGLIFVLINFIFDREIHRYFGLAGLSAWRERVQDARIANLQAEYQRIRDVDTLAADRRRREIRRQLERSHAWPFQ